MEPLTQPQFNVLDWSEYVATLTGYTYVSNYEAGLLSTILP